MNKNEIYILKGKECTNRIRSIRRLPSGLYEVYFIQDNRKFIYLDSNVQILRNRGIIDIKKHIALIDNEVQSDIKQIDDYGAYYKLTYKSGYERIIKKRLSKLLNSCLDNPNQKTKFDYFRSIAHEISLCTEKGKNILGSYYDKISFIREDTILANYFMGEISDNYHYNEHQNIFPFGFNTSQKLATENAMNYRISIIEGPPGTGKTQTILNLIANIVKDGKTVAVVSNNNSAIDNIYEKLQANGVDFIAARLGSVKNKQKFVSTQIMLLKEKLVSWKLNVSEQRKINAEINMLSNKIADILKEKNRLAILQSEFESIATEQKYFLAYFSDNYHDTEMPAFRKLVNPAKLIELWQKIETEKRASLFVKIWAYFFCGVKINNFYEQDSSIVITALQKSYYKAKIDKLKNTIERIKDYLSNNDISGNVHRHADLSMKIFQSHIANKYIETPRKFTYSLNDLWKRSREFIKDYPVVLSTTYSLRNSLSNDYVY